MRKLQTSLNHSGRSMRPIRARIVRPVMAACLVTAGLIAGCEDEQARKQAELQDTLEEVAATIEQVSINSAVAAEEFSDGSTGETFSVEDLSSQLQAALDKLSNLSDGSDGQQFAGGMLAASIERELSNMRLADVDAMIRNARSDRGEVHAKIKALHSLATAAAHAEGVAAGLSREELATIRRVRQERLDQLNQMISELEGPISDLATANDGERAQVEALKSQANDLRARAVELGPADGFPSLEEAVEHERRADHHEFTIANNEAESMYTLEAPQSWARTERDLFQKMVDTLDETRRDLDQLDSALRQRNTELSGDIGTLRNDISGSISALETRFNNEIQPKLDAALNHAQNAANKARSAASSLRGAAGNVAKVAQAQAEAMVGSIHWTRARSLGEHADLLAKAIEAGDAIGNTGALRSALDGVNSAIETSVAAARESYTAAQTTLQAAGGGEDVLALSDTIGMALAAVGGE